MGHTGVIGLQWGDEGKGKIVDVMLEHFDVAVRYGGGANAGHTVVIEGKKFALHQLPSGVLRGDRVLSVIGPGTVIDPAVLLGEIDSLRQRGVAVGEKLKISDRAHVVFPYHRQEDVLAEKAVGSGGKLGTTGRGIGPCYCDKMSRRFGVRVCDLMNPERLRERLGSIVAHKNAYFAAVYELRQPFDAGAIAGEYAAFAEQMRPFVCDTSVLLHEAMREGKQVLFEGAQGSLLDVDHGTYPYVTSSNSMTGGIASGAGVPPSAIGTVLGVVKAYATRVGSGPFPTELIGPLGDQIRERGHEYGTTTGRPRRCGWFDAVAARYSAMICGATHLAVMHLDTLSGMQELNICVAYRLGGKMMKHIPAEASMLEAAEPVLETLDGWSEDLRKCRRMSDLPAAARVYANRLSELLCVPLSIVSIGPGREETLFV